MLEMIMSYYHQIREILTRGSMKDIIRKRVFRQRIATPAEMDLSTLPPPGDSLKDFDYQFVELTMEKLRAGKLSFAVSSRRFKAFHNLKKGLRGFALVKDSSILGDLWCTAPTDVESCVTHPDLKMLGIQCKAGEAYAFDMLIDPTYRGKNLAVPLQRFLQSTLKKEGLQKVYGFYWDDNLPALWMHRMLKFKELPKRRVTRFFFIQYAKFLSQKDTSVKNAQKG